MQIHGNAMAKAEVGGIVKEISLALVDDVKVGDDIAPDIRTRAFFIYAA